VNLDELYLRVYGDPVLRVRTQEVTGFPIPAPLIERMFEIMYEEEGVGLAACQAGSEQRLMILDVPEEDGTPAFRGVIANPDITDRNGEQRGEEGCLSFPGIREDITRSDWIRVRARNERGEPIEFEARGLLSRAVQHELDHLDGVLFIDRMSPVRRRLLAKKLKRIASDRVSARAVNE
jgi:peptide deformylase